MRLALGLRGPKKRIALAVIMLKKGKVHKRLDSEPHVGLSKRQLKDLTEARAKPYLLAEFLFRAFQ
jgi:hypothetical protein